MNRHGPATSQGRFCVCSYLDTLRHPERYHGQGKAPPFFEGWYFKIVDATERHRLAIIPAIFLSAESEQQHAFVQVLEGESRSVTYHRYPSEAFAWHDRPFQVSVGPNRFGLDWMSLDIHSPERTIHGQIALENIMPWPVTWFSPGIMGPFAWLPFLETYHGVLSLDHSLSGSLEINGRSVSFDGGRGYVEKDWGTSFPSAWVWLQTNHFSRPGTSLTASVANIPIGPWRFPGFIVGLWHDGRLHRFATYNLSRIERLEVGGTTVSWTLRNRDERLEIVATRAQGGLLRGPSKVDMGVRVPETLGAQAEVRLSVLRAGEAITVFHDTGRHAGLEIVGDVALLGA